MLVTTSITNLLERTNMPERISLFSRILHQLKVLSHIFMAKVFDASLDLMIAI